MIVKKGVNRRKIWSVGWTSLLWGVLLSVGCAGSEKTGHAGQENVVSKDASGSLQLLDALSNQTESADTARWASLQFLFRLIPTRGCRTGFGDLRRSGCCCSPAPVTWFRLSSGADLFPEPIDMYDNQCRDLVMGSQRWLYSLYCVNVWLQPKGAATPFVSLKNEEMVQSVLFNAVVHHQRKSPPGFCPTLLCLAYISRSMPR